MKNKQIIRLSKRKKYGHVISLDYNCEVSFQFFKKYHFVESSLFAWVNCIDCKHIIKALQNLDDLTSKGFKKEPPMYRDVASDILFHSKKEEGETEEELQSELKSRILHLKEKFLKTACDGKKNLYIFKYPTQKKTSKFVRQEIMQLYNVLKSLITNDFDLLIIIEKGAYEDLTLDVENIYVERVAYFTPENAVTTKPYDKKGYSKIFSRFCPDFKLPHQKKFKFEDENKNTKKTRLKNSKSYDVICSIGAACSAAQALIEANLRQFSAPFDWVWGSDFLGRVKIFTSDFERFLEKEDLTFCNYNNGDKKNLCDVYENHHTKLFFNHDFAAGISLDETYPAIKEKYNRRITRFLNSIKDANTVLVIYLETPDAKAHASDEDIINGCHQIEAKYPNKTIDFLYFINDTNLKPKVMKKYRLSNNITKIVGNYKNQKEGSASYAVNMKFLGKFFSKYHLNMPLKKKIKLSTIKHGIRLIPVKSVRRKMQRKYHVK